MAGFVAPDGTLVTWLKNPLIHGFIGWKREPGVTESPDGQNIARSFGPQEIIGLSIKPGETWKDHSAQHKLLLNGRDAIVPVWWDPTIPAHVEEMEATIREYNIDPERKFEASSYRMVEVKDADKKKPWDKFVREPVTRVGFLGCLALLKDVSAAAEKVLSGEIDVGAVADASLKISAAEKRAAGAEAQAAALKAQLEAAQQLLDAMKTKEAESAAARVASDANAARGGKPGKPASSSG